MTNEYQQLQSQINRLKFNICCLRNDIPTVDGLPLITEGAILFGAADGTVEDDSSFLFNSTTNQLSVNGSAVTSAQLNVDSVTRGFLQPRMTTAQRLAIASPVEGLSVYDTTLDVPFYYNGTTWVENGGAKYLVYTSLLTQSGTGAPTSTVLQNTLGAPIVWARTSPGVYTGTLAAAFVTNKTWLYIDSQTNMATLDAVRIVRTSANVVTVTTDVAGAPSDDFLAGTSLEIRVYP